ncbi:TonB-dependent receptor plug domain-containing protein [Pedobacter sp.]|uniref:TonB-dependent receptor plug domain-containing protein n=1 Tax=Pedobacter sp. TaxID=1411316 RepID=UPI00396CD921
MNKYLYFLFFVLNSHAILAQISIQGKITDHKQVPLEYVTVRLPDFDRITYTDKGGLFSFIIDAKEIKSFKLQANMVGKEKFDKTISVGSVTQKFYVPITLLDLNLSLNEVQVSAVQKTTNLSNSSVLFDRQAIEQAQAFSLADILNGLPGKLYSPVDLQSPKNLTLRSEASGNAANNNAMGIAIIIDGLAQNNNANMQAKNVGTYGLGNSTITDRTNNVGYDVTFGGLDLREIPADNIESIEVISGVAPAQYGDLTDGAIIINRQAGKTPFMFNTRINNGSTNFSLTKGFKLPEKYGFLNTNINYLVSNDDPRDNMKKYNRVSGGIMHTIYFNHHIKNTISLDYSEKLDDAKRDPDDGTEKMAYSKNRRFAISNRLSWQLNSKVIKSISLNAGLDMGFQDSYSQWYLNGNVKPMANKDTTGVYEGYYLPGNYLAVDQVVGKPKNFNGNISFSSHFNVGEIKHILSYGASISIASNKGKGVLFDPERPRFISQGYKNERPYDFELLPDLINSGIYLEDRFNIKVFNRNLRFNAGLRYDIQNGYGTLQPRINANYSISKNLSFNAAYGIATKAPTMAYRYPGPTYFDLPILNVYTGDVRNSLFLVYTYKYLPDNSSLKPSQSNQAEIGLSYSHPLFNASVNGYLKNNKNGFAGQSQYFGIMVPDYTYNITNNQKPVYQPTGTYTLKGGLANSVITNNVSSSNNGIELFISVKKITAIQTSFSFNSSYTYSSFYNSNELIAKASDADILANKKAWYAIYDARESINKAFTYKLNSDTHIPKLGLVVSLYFDFVWLKNQLIKGDNAYPKAYLDSYGNRYPIDNFDPNNPDYGHLTRSADLETQAKLPFSYANVSMRLAKELKNNIRFSVNAYNVFNLKANYYDPKNNKSYSYLNPLSIGAELSIKF